MYEQLPLSQQEVVRFDVAVDDADVVQLLHHVQNTDGEVYDEGLRHHLVTQGFINVHCVLKEESQFQGMEDKMVSVSCLVTAFLMWTYQQSAVAVKLAEQHAPIVEDVSWANAAVEMTDFRLQPSVQLSVDVKLPGIGWFLNLQWQQQQEADTSAAWERHFIKNVFSVFKNYDTF